MEVRVHIIILTYFIDTLGFFIFFSVKSQYYFTDRGQTFLDNKNVGKEDRIFSLDGKYIDRQIGI